jgi:hypothetical protein
VPPRLPQQAQLQTTYVDRPEISETYVDLLYNATCEGLNIKLELVVNRALSAMPGAPISIKSTTACRLVMPLPGMLDMLNKLSGLAATLQAQGLIKSVGEGSPTVN